MFDAHPPFQIDGNFGGTSAIAEMLLQGDDGGDPPAAVASGAWPDGRVHRPESARRVRDRSRLDARRARARDRSFAAWTAAAPAPREHAAHVRHDARRNADAGRRRPAAAGWRRDSAGRHGSPDRHDRSERLRPVSRTHQPLGRGWAVRRADSRRRLRGQRFRNRTGRPSARRTPCASSTTPFERGTKSVRITAGAQRSGIRQRRVFLESGRSYDGSLWIKIETGAPRLSWRVLAADGSVLAERPLPARGSAWVEMPFSFTSARTDRDATIEIAAAGRGAVLVDFVSLMRADVRKSGMLRPDLLASLRGLAPTFIRWPGGSFASTYKWQDGIGPFASRVYHPNEMWGGYSDYYGFGTDEYLELTRQLGADPLIVLAAPDDTPTSVEYAMNWVHYVNDPAIDDVGADARAQRPSRAVPRSLLPDRQRADEQRLHARALRRHRESLREPPAADRAGCCDRRLRPEALERHGVERKGHRSRRQEL